MIGRLYILIIAVALLGCGSNDSSKAQTLPDEYIPPVVEDTVCQPEYPAGVMALMKSYPDCIIGFEDGNIIFADSARMVYDDGKDKDFEALLDNSDIEDMFGIRYVRTDSAPAYLSDPGRIRCDALFKKMYGSTATEVQKNLKPVKWIGETVRFTSVNGAADSLAKVAAELEQYPQLRRYLKSSGTFYWRKVRGAQRMSAHSYGIAFDIGVDKSDYWLWRNPGAKETSRIKYNNQIPKQVVDAFERHGFIWGGNWYHYDTMHFEFRPDLLWYSSNSN